jgi:hypothetical protein
MNNVLEEEYFKSVGINKDQTIFLKSLLNKDHEFKYGKIVQCNFYAEKDAIRVNGLFAGKLFNKCFAGYIYFMPFEYNIELNVDVLMPEVLSYASHSQIINYNNILEEVNYDIIPAKNKRVKR